MTDRVFVDTNLLVYSFDRSDLRKWALARQVLHDLWSTRRGVLSTQVLAEFFVVATAKLRQPLQPQVAARIVGRYLQGWPVVVVTGATLSAGTERSSRTGRKLWDCLIIEAARAAGAVEILSEDFGHGQEEDDVRFRNPFA